MNVHKEYGEQSGQLINKEKSCLSIISLPMHNRKVEETTSFNKHKFTLIYIEFPIHHAKTEKVNFFKLMKKVHNKLQAWKGKMLTFRGKTALIYNL